LERYFVNGASLNPVQRSRYRCQPDLLDRRMSKLKIETARRRLGTALGLYLWDRDPVAVHCLANGGCELIEYYAEKAGGQRFSSHILRAYSDLDIKELRRIQRKYWTAFKHATHQHSGKERDDDGVLMEFNDEKNDHALFIGWYDYALATQTMPIEAQVHQAWYLALHPIKLSQQHSAQPYEQLFPDLRSRPRAEQKRMLNAVIEDARADRDNMTDSRTDTRSLILGWSMEKMPEGGRAEGHERPAFAPGVVERA
jgi:hypothetical protein